jgi:uncharacterized protein YbjT (DUF2867 family)
MENEMNRRIILAGATGLIGGHAVRILLDAGHDVSCIMRRKDENLASAAHQIIAATEQWPERVCEVGADVAISCLGTTMRDAGSKAAFAAVDLELVTSFAAAAKAGGASHFISVSSVGADMGSSNFYLATKGKAEAKLAALGFARFDIMQPGLLRGDRDGPVRFGEQIGVLLSPLTDMLMMGSLARYRSISAENVARAIAALASAEGQGRFFHQNPAIEHLAS